MQSEEKLQRKTQSRLSLSFKCGAIFLLFLISVVVAACGASATSADLNSPQITVTISFDNKTPVPTAPPYTCGAWVTNTTPVFLPGSRIAVYGKFIHNVNGSPVGVGGATATATIVWADQYTDAPQTVTTTADGLAVVYFTVPNRPGIVNKNNSVSFAFNGDGASCNADKDRAAYFTFVGVTPTVAPSPSPTATANPGGPGSATPTSTTMPELPLTPSAAPTVPGMPNN